MRILFILSLCVAVLVSTGCTSSTEHGACIGAFDDKDPKLVYKASVWNIFVAIIFVETIIVPIWVVVDQTLCPVAKKVPV